MDLSMKQVVERLREDGNVAKSWFERYKNPKPLSAKEIAGLKLPGGGALPTDLKEWLAYDASWLPLFEPEGPRRLCSRPLEDVLREWAAEHDPDAEPDSGEEMSESDLVKYWVKILPAKVAKVHAVLLPSGDQESLLMLEPKRPALRVLGCHKRMEFWWKYETFAGYLAHLFGFSHPE